MYHVYIISCTVVNILESQYLYYGHVNKTILYVLLFYYMNLLYNQYFNFCCNIVKFNTYTISISIVNVPLFFLVITTLVLEYLKTFYDSFLNSLLTNDEDDSNRTCKIPELRYNNFMI